MPLPKQIVQFPFAGGLNEHTSDFVAEPPVLTTAKNVRMTKTGELEKRPGTSLVASLTHPTSKPMTAGAGALASYRDEVVLVDGQRAFSYSPTLGLMQYKDHVSEALATRTSISTVAPGAHGYDIAYGNGVVAIVYAAAGASALYLTVYDATTGAEIYSSYPVTTTGIIVMPRIFFVGDDAVILYRDALSAGVVYAVLLSSSFVLSGAPTVIVNDKLTDSYVACGMSDRFAIAYAVDNGVGTPVIRVRTFNSAFAQLASNVTAVTIAGLTFDIQGTTAETLWFAYPEYPAGTVVKVIGFNPATLAITISPYAIYTLAGTDTALNMVSLARVTSAAELAVIDVATVVAGTQGNATVPVYFTAGGVTIAGAPRKTYWSSLASRPFAVGSKCYVWVYTSSGTPSLTTSQFTAVLCDIGVDDATANLLLRPVAVVSPRFAQLTAVGNEYKPCSVMATSPSTYTTVTQINRNNLGSTGLVLVTADFGSTDCWRPSVMGESLYLSGGLPSYYDSSRVGEVGFLYEPRILSGAETTVVGGLIANGTYLYKVCYEHSTQRGEILRSAPSAQLSVTTAGANNAVSLTVSSQCLTTRQDAASSFLPPISVVVYRTKAGESSPFYKVFSESLTPQNDPRAETLTITDISSDTAIAVRPTLYTEGGVLDNVCPPSFVAMAVHKNRLWGVSDDLRTLYFSKQFADGETPGFCDEFTITLDTAGALTALASMDDALIIFSADSIYVLYGDGPTDTDVGSDYGLPRKLATNVGCIDQRSLLLTDTGLYFQSALGLYMLSRGLQCSNVGLPVQDALNDNPTLTSAVIHPSGSHMIWSANASSTGVRLVFLDNDKQWVTDDVHATNGSSKILSSCTNNGVYYFLDDQARVYKEDSATYLDVGNWVTYDVESAWIKTSGLQGFQRIWRASVLGKKYTSHDLRVQIGTDYNTAYNQSRTWLSYVTDAYTIGQYVSHVQSQKCKAIRVRITDATPTGGSVGTGRGLSVAGLAFEVGAKQGVGKVSSVQRG